MHGACVTPKSHHPADQLAESGPVVSGSILTASFKCVFGPRRDGLSGVAQKREYPLAAGYGVPSRVMSERTEKRLGFADTLRDGGSNPRTNLYNRED